MRDVNFFQKIFFSKLDKFETHFVNTRNKYQQAKLKKKIF